MNGIRCASGMLLVLLLGVVACMPAAVTGSGNLTTETRPVETFNEVRLAGAGTLLIEQGDTDALRIDAEDNLLPHIKSDVQDHRLILQLQAEPGTPVRPTQPIIFNLTAKNLNAVELSGAGAMRAGPITTSRLKVTLGGSGGASLDDLTAEELQVKVVGTGDATVSGTVQRLEVNISGAGHYRGDNLQSNEASIMVSGSGNSTVRVSGRLEANISGSGSVEYRGNPEISQNIIGSGTLTKRGN